MTYRLQPEPIRSIVLYMPVAGGRTVTTIVRTWVPGMSRFCNLCKSCNADDNLCVTITNWKVPVGEAAMFAPGRFKEIATAHDGEAGR